MTVPVGIHDITLATARYALDLGELARRFDVDVNKFYTGIGQRVMSVPAEDEDIVTMGASAAARLLERDGGPMPRTLLFATETGIDQSKSAGVYVHGLLGMPAECRVLELKQACYSAAGALQLALGLVARSPDERVLVIASDIARYDLASSGEATQGAAAVAFLVQRDPALIEIEPASGLHTLDVQDFWRPNSRNTALVDGKYSVKAYIDSLKGAFDDYRAHGGASIDEIDRFCYHQPFTKMAVKAHTSLLQHTGRPADRQAVADALAPTFTYNAEVGNSYTASIFIGLLALLDGDVDLTGERIGFFSYGSGAVSEFFSGRVMPGYEAHLHRDEHASALLARESIDYERYLTLHPGTEVSSRGDYTTAAGAGRFRFTGVREHSREYLDVERAPESSTAAEQ